MIKRLFAVGILLAAAALAADSLKIESDIPAEGVFSERNPLKFTLTLDQPADEVRLEYQAFSTGYLQLNSATFLPLVPDHGKRTFRGELRVENSYGVPFRAGQRYGPGAIRFVPTLRRGKETLRLEPVPLPWSMKLDADVSFANRPLYAPGKFGDGLGFDGEAAMASVNRIAFNPESGTIEAWIFMPLLISDKGRVLFFLQSSDGSPWSYHQLTIPPNSRQLEYGVYRGADRSSVSLSSGKDLAEEDWMHVMMTHDIITKKMELFVNGKSLGSAPYESSAGGKFSELTLGGRIHYAKEGIQFVSNCQMLIDEVRISDIIRPHTVQGKPFAADGNTLLLLHFDGMDCLKNSRE